MQLVGIETVSLKSIKYVPGSSLMPSSELLRLKGMMEVFEARRRVLSKSMVAGEPQAEICRRVRSMPQGCCWWVCWRRLEMMWRVRIWRPLRIMVLYVCTYYSVLCSEYRWNC